MFTVGKLHTVTSRSELFKRGAHGHKTSSIVVK